MKLYKDSPLWDYFYRNASSDYISEVGIPNQKVRSAWIANRISDELEEFDKQANAIQELIRSNPRVNEIMNLSR